MEKLNRLGITVSVVFINRYFMPMFQQCKTLQTTLTACKLAYIRWDEAKGRFVRSKNTHLFDLLLSICLVATISLLLVFQLIYSGKKPDFEYILSCVMFMWGSSGCLVTASMVFQRNILILFLNWYVTVQQALENGKQVYSCFDI